jgi:hypothetical protein
MFNVMNITQAGYGAGNGPVVFFNNAQILLQFADDSFPERNFLSNPLLIETGTFFRYLRVFLASAFVPFRNGVLERPMPAADKIVTNPSKSWPPVKYSQH